MFRGAQPAAGRACWLLLASCSLQDMHLKQHMCMPHRQGSTSTATDCFETRESKAEVMYSSCTSEQQRRLVLEMWQHSQLKGAIAHTSRPGSSSPRRMLAVTWGSPTAPTLSYRRQQPHCPQQAQSQRSYGFVQKMGAE